MGKIPILTQMGWNHKLDLHFSKNWELNLLLGNRQTIISSSSLRNWSRCVRDSELNRTTIIQHGRRRQRKVAGSIHTPISLQNACQITIGWMEYMDVLWKQQRQCAVSVPKNLRHLKSLETKAGAVWWLVGNLRVLCIQQDDLWCFQCKQFWGEYTVFLSLLVADVLFEDWESSSAAKVYWIFVWLRKQTMSFLVIRGFGRNTDRFPLKRPLNMGTMFVFRRCRFLSECESIFSTLLCIDTVSLKPGEFQVTLDGQAAGWRSCQCIAEASPYYFNDWTILHWRNRFSCF